jgi:hypothetical protein
MATSNLPAPQLQPLADEKIIEIVSEGAACCGGGCCSTD